MNVEMKFYILIIVSTIFFFLTTTVTAQDEESTVSPDNVLVDTTIESAPESNPEPETEGTPNLETEIRTENKSSSGDTKLTEVDTVTGYDINLTHETVTPTTEGDKVAEVKMAEDENVEEQNTPSQEYVTTILNEGIQVTEANVKEVEAMMENGTIVPDNTTPALGEGVLPTEDKTFMKTLSQMTDHDDIKKSQETEKTADKSVRNQENTMEKISDLKEDTVETDNIKIEPEEKLLDNKEDQDQKEVNIVFPTNNPNKEDEFERMAKQIKPNKELDENLANKLAGDWGEHLDQNKEDEQPSIVFETKNNKTEYGESMKLESETEISDDDKKTDSEDVNKIKPEHTSKDITIAPQTSTEEQKDKETNKISEESETDIADDNKKTGSKGAKAKHTSKDVRIALPTSTEEQINKETTKISEEPENEISDDEKAGSKNVKTKHISKDVRITLQTSTETTKISDLKRGALKTTPKAIKHDESVDQHIKTNSQKDKILDESVEISEEKRTSQNASTKEQREKPENLRESQKTEDSNEDQSKDKTSTLQRVEVERSEEKKGISKSIITGNANNKNDSIHKKMEDKNMIVGTAISQEDHNSHENPVVSEPKNKKNTNKVSHDKTSTPNITPHEGNGHKLVKSKVEKVTEGIADHIKKENIGSGKNNASLETYTTSSKNKEAEIIKNHMTQKTTDMKTSSKIKTTSTPPKMDVTVKNVHATDSEEELMKKAMEFEKLQHTTESPVPEVSMATDIQSSTQINQTTQDDDGSNINVTLVFAEIIFRHGDRYKGEGQEETYPNDPYAVEDPFWLPYGCDQIRNKGKMRSFWLGQYLRRRYAGFLPEEFYNHDIRVTSADLNRCIDSAHVMGAGLYPPKGINIWNDNVGRYYQPIPVRTLHPSDDIFLNEEVVCPPYEKELKKVLNKKMKNFNAKYRYVYEYLEMYTGMPVKNLEDVAQIYTTLRIENENGRKLPDWVNLVFPDHLKMLNSYYNQIRLSSHFFKRTQAGPLLSIIMDELKQKSLNRLKPNYKIKFWSGFDTTILKLLYTMKENQPSLEKAEDLLETDYSGSLMIEMHLINKQYFIKVLYINMDPLFWKSHTPRPIKICEGLSLCPLETFLAKMEKYRVSQKEWFRHCNISYCTQQDQPDNSIQLRPI